MQDQFDRECARVQDLVGAAVQEIENDGGDIRLFAAAYLAFAIRLYCEIEGTEALERSITRLGREEFRARGIGTC